MKSLGKVLLSQQETMFLNHNKKVTSIFEVTFFCHIINYFSAVSAAIVM